MSKKEDVKARLTELGIAFEEDAKTADLEGLLPADDTVNKEAEDEDEIIVGDPMDLRPVSLPLVVKLPETASKAQMAYAKTLNGYAYKNPTKWAKKKDALIANLKALKNAPDPVEMEGGLQYKNNLLGA